jgi:hypothetical protein
MSSCQRLAQDFWLTPTPNFASSTCVNQNKTAPRLNNGCVQFGLNAFFRNISYYISIQHSIGRKIFNIPDILRSVLDFFDVQYSYRVYK